MAVQSRNLGPQRRASIGLPAGNVGNIAYIITGLLALLAAYVLLSSAIGFGRTTLDNIRYGYPRTFHLSANVGRPEEANGQTHLIAMNLDRQVVILEIPGGDASKIRTLPGPYLFGSDENLTPVTMRLSDVNGDGAADLLVRVKDEEMVYLNRDNTFNLISAEERQQLVQGSGQ